MTTTHEDTGTLPQLDELGHRFVMHWGEMGGRWGINRTVSQIHALLYLHGEPLTAEAIALTLGVARSNVSNSLRELQGWGLIKLVHRMGDRRDHFTTEGDVWALFNQVVRERKAREFDPTVAFLNSLRSDPALCKAPTATQQRIVATAELMSLLSTWGNEVLALPPPTLVKLMRLGAKIQKLIPGRRGAA